MNINYRLDSLMLKAFVSESSRTPQPGLISDGLAPSYATLGYKTRRP
jgi:hypothetical protein